MRLFAHRGFVTESHPENSVASLKEAVAQGFKAIEFDLWFVERRLVLNHDRPQEDQVPILPELSDYLAYKNELSYWLDFKNLDEENHAKALICAKAAVDEMEVNLDNIYFAPFETDFAKAEKNFLIARNILGTKVNNVAVCEILKDENAALELRKFLDRNHIKCLSIAHQLLNKNTLNILAGIEIFAWTVNDLQRLKELESLGVTNFATDKITPKIYATNNSSRTS